MATMLTEFFVKFLNVFNLFRLCRKDEISFDIVAKNGNVEATFDVVEATLYFQLLCRKNC